MDGEVILTKRVQDLPPGRLLRKIALSFKVLGNPVIIHIEFKDQIEINELPRTVLECPVDGLLDELESQIWVHKPEEGVMDSIAEVEEDFDGRDSQQEDQP